MRPTVAAVLQENDQAESDAKPVETKAAGRLLETFQAITLLATLPIDLLILSSDQGQSCMTVEAVLPHDVTDGNPDKILIPAAQRQVLLRRTVVVQSTILAPFVTYREWQSLPVQPLLNRQEIDQGPEGPRVPDLSPLEVMKSLDPRKDVVVSFMAGAP